MDRLTETARIRGDRTGDHRVRVAEERRRRMKAHLELAIVECCVNKADFRPPSVDEVCVAAQVSRATFYKYFDSVDSAVATIGESLLDDMVHDLASVFDGDTAIERIAIGLQLFLMRSATDAAWASFVSRVIQIRPETAFAERVAVDMREAEAEGRIRVFNLDAAISLALGAMFEAIRHVHKTGDRRRDYVEGVVTMVLRGLGIEEADAARLVRAKAIHIRGQAPDCLAWWRDPWI